eukprot:2631334-Pleurochrysis_carterae.AAC.1
MNSCMEPEEDGLLVGPFNARLCCSERGHGNGGVLCCRRSALESMLRQNECLSLRMLALEPTSRASMMTTSKEALGLVSCDFRGNGTKNVRIHTGIRLDTFDLTSSS